MLNAETNKVVFERANDEKLSPASTTKIVTAMVDRKYCSLDEMVMVGEELDYVAPDASGAYLCKGDCLSIEDLL